MHINLTKLPTGQHFMVDINSHLLSTSDWQWGLQKKQKAELERHPGAWKGLLFLAFFFPPLVHPLLQHVNSSSFLLKFWTITVHTLINSVLLNVLYYKIFTDTFIIKELLTFAILKDSSVFISVNSEMFSKLIQDSF